MGFLHQASQYLQNSGCCLFSISLDWTISSTPHSVLLSRGLISAKFSITHQGTVATLLPWGKRDIQPLSLSLSIYPPFSISFFFPTPHPHPPSQICSNAYLCLLNAYLILWKFLQKCPYIETTNFRIAIIINHCGVAEGSGKRNREG